MAFAIAMAIISIPFSLDAANNGGTGRVVLGVAIGLVGLTSAVTVAPMLRVRRRNLPHNIHSTHSNDASAGLRIPFRSTWQVVVTTWLIVAVAFLVIRGILFFSHLSNDSNSGRSAIDTGGIVVVIVALALAVVMLLYLLTGKNRRGSLVLREQGITLSLASTTRSISWDEVGDISPCIINDSRVVRIRPRSDARIEVETGRNLLDRMQRGYYEQNIDLIGWVLNLDPALLMHLLQFYWRHPEARNELTANAAIDRMQRGELV